MNQHRDASFGQSPTAKLASSLAFVVLAGCGAKPPACGDEQTVGIVKSIYKDAVTVLFAQHEGGPELATKLLAVTPLEVKTVQTVGKDAGVGMLTCEADLSVTVPEVIAKYAGTGAVSAAGPAVMAQTRNARVTGNAITQPIRYTVQETDDRKQIVVKSEGVSAIAQLVGNLAFLGLMEHALDLSGGTPATALAASVAASGVAAASPPPPVPTATTPKPATVTRFGPVTFTDDQHALFQGKPMNPPLNGSNGLEVSQKFEIGADDVLLVQETGGTACPAQFYFVRVNAADAGATPSFGTCSDVPTVVREGDALRITMPGYVGSTQSAAEQEAAAKESHVFVYQAGAVREVAAKAAADQSKPSFSCAGKLSSVEQLICATPSLAQADVTLGQAYAAAVAKASDPAGIKQQQRDWRKTRDACPDAACISAAYTSRIEALSR